MLLLSAAKRFVAGLLAFVAVCTPMPGVDSDWSRVPAEVTRRAEGKFVTPVLPPWCLTTRRKGKLEG